MGLRFLGCQQPQYQKLCSHWNSFTSGFFLQLDAVITALQGPQGCVAVDAAAAEGLLRQGLACHRCGQGLKNMPALKEHLRSCTHK
jgi:hypothetical protein